MNVISERNFTMSSVKRFTDKAKQLLTFSNLRKLFVVLIALNLVILLTLALRGIVTIPQDINLGPLQVHLYSLALLTAFGVCTYLVSVLIEQEPVLKAADVWEGLMFVFIPAIIFARAYHVITDFYLYTSNPINVFAIWNGGLGFIGGLIGGALGLYFYTRYRKLPLQLVLSVTVVVVPLGQAIGRLGNFFNHELYGPPTDLPWGQFIPLEFRKPQYVAYDFFQPLFLYEALANLVLFAILYRLWKRGMRDYRLIMIYLAGYGIIRFSLDFLRIDGNSGVYGLTYAQWLIVGGFILVGIVCAVKRWAFRKQGNA